MAVMARRVWAWPVTLGLLTTSGLCSALVSDAWGDVWSWLALGVPVLVMVRHALWSSSRRAPAPVALPLSSPEVRR